MQILITLIGPAFGADFTMKVTDSGYLDAQLFSELHPCTHLVSSTSYMSAVGTSSKLRAYGNNRADLFADALVREQ